MDISIRNDTSRLEYAIEKARDYLMGIQSEDGFWAGELEADASVTAGYIPLMYYMRGKVDPERQRKVINNVKARQRPDGSWSTYYGGPGDLSVSIQVYFALKLAGISPDETLMQQARAFIVNHGGITKANLITKVWLAVFGQFPWKGTPAMPPEIVFLPNWFYFNIYEFASWSRATIMALMIVLTEKPVCNVPEYAQISELYVEPENERVYSLGKTDKIISWKSFFLVMDSLFKTWEKIPFKPGRRTALQNTERWIIDHQEADGSWGGIMLPWVYSLIALKWLGYPLDHPVIDKGIKGLEGFIAEDEDSLRLLPATSPVWDTAWAVIALSEAGLAPDHQSMIRAGRWLLKEEIRIGGDWKVKNTKTEPGCWAFEFDNDLYPDIDDTSLVPRALMKVQLSGEEERAKIQAANRGLQWVLSMQSRDGGWAAFDVNNTKQFLSQIPFADFMTPLDPTSTDVTAHVLELLGEMNQDGTSLKKALNYVKSQQEADGSWYGRWGVNYIYGTGGVLPGLRVVGEDMGQEYIRKAVSWLYSHQNEDGGWGETCHTYDDPTSRGIGPSTPSQTAWALIGLIAAGETNSPSVIKGINYLLKNQCEDGSWREDEYTGTGFPRAFYLRYDLYRIYFPLIALARYKASAQGGSG